MKILKEIQKQFKRFHIFHNWTKWEFLLAEDGMYVKNSMYASGSELPHTVNYIQQRECTECGLCELRKVKLF